VLVKLHRQFGHATSERLGNLLKSSGSCNAEILALLSSVVENCDICLKYKRAVPRPVVGFPLASDYNETVALDLFQLEKNVWVLHMIDEFSEILVLVRVVLLEQNGHLRL
jgi:hypothetical protein